MLGIPKDLSETLQDVTANRQECTNCQSTG
ncbi:rCG36164 [Rattus norvegicus]|uniref:RCG36164 n=1 Tax=Rattus norvegicus TaxID=10116 RepID=A6IJW2_RAT|nr:rCG36164 [Rattus norvegicus]